MNQTGEALSLWMRVPNAHHAWMRIVKGGDPAKVGDRRVFVEKTPRVLDPGGHPRALSWISGHKGHADDGDGPDLDSRRWADDKARELGYVLPDMSVELDELKRSWAKDPSWDIEDTDGFEEHRAELVAWRADRDTRLEAEAARDRATAIEELMAPAVKYLQKLDDEVVAGKRDAPTFMDLIRALGEVLHPIVERLGNVDDRLSDLDGETDQALADHKAELDELREQIGAA